MLTHTVQTKYSAEDTDFNQLTDNRQPLQRSLHTVYAFQLEVITQTGDICSGAVSVESK